MKSRFILFSFSDLKRKNKFSFTLIELIAAMGVFSLIMVMMMTLFLSAQHIWRKTSQESTVFENARIALDLMARDIQCTYYEPNKTLFWYKPATSYAAPDKLYNNPSICFIADTLVPPNPHCESKLCEIKYQLYGMTFGTKNASDGWLLRSATGDRKEDGSNNLYSASSNPTGKFKFYNFFTIKVRGGTPAAQVFTLDNGSSEDWQKVIPYVTALTFECNRRDGSVITGYSPSNPTTSYTLDKPKFDNTPLPFSIRVNITLLDMDSWNKWVAMVGSSSSEPAAAVTFRQQRERKFSKIILLGERGQGL